jgi:hypothetical protein
MKLLFFFLNIVKDDKINFMWVFINYLYIYIFCNIYKINISNSFIIKLILCGFLS